MKKIVSVRIPPPFPIEEFMTLSRNLERYHGIFYRLWSLGKPIFVLDGAIKTAGVTFNSLGDCVNFFIDFDFWQTLTDYQKLFVICHECLHVMLNHGLRIRGLTQMLLANRALDVVVNHLLLTSFGFDRSLVDPDNKYCWIDTVFKVQDPAIPSNKAFEFYYALIQDPNQCNNLGNSLDDHDYLSSQNFQDLCKKLNDTLTPGEKDSLKSLLGKHVPDRSATETIPNWLSLPGGLVPKKKKWETVIKKWSSKFLIDVEEDQWISPDRRHILLDKKLNLPAEAEPETDDKERITVWFFQDTSGSCYHLAERFFKAAQSLPPNRFDVKMHCFDTRVYETSLATRKLYGFGGTTFDCIEEFVQKKIKETGIKYPASCWVVTDGLGNKVVPEFPERWHWFLDETGWSYSSYVDQCVPKESKRYQLKEFE